MLPAAHMGDAMDDAPNSSTVTSRESGKYDDFWPGGIKSGLMHSSLNDSTDADPEPIMDDDNDNSELLEVILSRVLKSGRQYSASP